jgi:hypothetical protein
VDRLYIGQLDGKGLDTSLKPFATPDNAFAQLNNAYIFRGRVRKRFGSRLLQGTDPQIPGMEQIQSRLKMTIGTTDGAGAFPAAPFTVPGTVFEIGQSFSVGSVLFTVYQNGAMKVGGLYTSTTDNNGNAAAIVPGAVGAIGQTFTVGNQVFTSVVVNGAMTVVGSGNGTGTFNTVTGAYTFTNCLENTPIYWVSNLISGTYNLATGDVTITGAPAATTVYWYPSQPVMGLVTLEQSDVNSEDIVGFDTQFSYKFGDNGWDLLNPNPVKPTVMWTGTNYEGFWGFNTPGAKPQNRVLFVTNNKDPIRYLIGSTWTIFQPVTNSLDAANNFIQTARIIIYFQRRLLFMNTVETVNGVAGISFVNRIRFSWPSSPDNSLIDAANTFSIFPATGGGFTDAPTKEAIITAQFLKDRLIVYFESSTYELVFTNNQVEPFRWQKINTDRGAESTFSQIPFDKAVLGIGNIGIHACNGNYVERIDEQIPDTVFNIHNDFNGPDRVVGVRDYRVEMIYWAIPDVDRTATSPWNNKVLTYNYLTGSWGINDDSITAFGYFQTNIAGTSTGMTWEQWDTTWEESFWVWESGPLQAKYRNVVAGNQQGWTFICDPNINSNCQALQISNISVVNNLAAILTVKNHNLLAGDYIKIQNCIGITGLNNTIFSIDQVIDENTIVVYTSSPVIFGIYKGSGVIARVTPIDILTKQFNFYASSGRNAAISTVNFLVTRTDNGECVVDFLIGSSSYGMIQQAKLAGCLLGQSILDTKPYVLSPFEKQQDVLWHPVYFNAQGEYIQFHLYLNDTQTRDSTISEATFELHAFIVNAMPTSSQLQ